MKSYELAKFFSLCFDSPDHETEVLANKGQYCHETHNVYIEINQILIFHMFLPSECHMSQWSLGGGHLTLDIKSLSFFRVKYL